MRKWVLSNLELTQKGIISKLRMKHETLGIWISFGSEKGKFEAAADFCGLLLWGALEAG